MAPIRVGFLGPSAAEGAGSSWASNAHLPYILANPSQYTIVALCNSSVDGILFALSSEFDSFSAILGNQRPSVSVLDKTNSTVEGTFQKDAPDQILIQGRLEPSDALLSYHLSGGKALPGEPALLWRIYGENGEIEVTGNNAVLMIGTGQERIRVWDFKASEAEDVLWTDGLKELPQPGRNVGRLYEAFASGSGENHYPDWSIAVNRHQLLSEIDKMKGF